MLQKHNSSEKGNYLRNIINKLYYEYKKCKPSVNELYIFESCTTYLFLFPDEAYLISNYK